MSDKFILDGHKVVPIEDLFEWGKWMQTAERHVADTTLPNGTRISTVFLGLNHSYEDRVPALFETMIFGGELNQEMEQYPTWQDAEEGHKRWVSKAQPKVEQGKIE